MRPVLHRCTKIQTRNNDDVNPTIHVERNCFEDNITTGHIYVWQFIGGTNARVLTFDLCRNI